MDNVTGIFHSAWRADGNAERKRNPFYLYNRVLYIKANPRDEIYMKKLFAEHYPGGTFINAGKTGDWKKTVPLAGQIVLLYPDAIGLSYRPIETRVLRLKKKTADVYVLNGRRRKFLFPDSRSNLYIRRIGERSMFTEFLAIILFIIITPVILISDLAGGHR